MSRAIAKLTGRVDVEESNFSSAAFVAVPNHGDSVTGNEHLVIPGGTRVDVRRKRVNRGDGFQSTIANCHRKEAPTTQHYEVIAVHGDKVWVRNVQTHLDGLTSLNRCRKINGAPAG